MEMEIDLESTFNCWLCLQSWKQSSQQFTESNETQFPRRFLSTIQDGTGSKQFSSTTDRETCQNELVYYLATGMVNLNCKAMSLSDPSKLFAQVQQQDLAV